MHDITDRQKVRCHSGNGVPDRLTGHCGDLGGMAQRCGVQRPGCERTSSCMVGCAKTGFGLVQRNGEFLEFDESGNKEALELLKNTKKDEKEIGVKVTGTLKGGTIEVSSIDPR